MGLVNGTVSVLMVRQAATITVARTLLEVMAFHIACAMVGRTGRMQILFKLMIIDFWN
jgi:hypothetical protein